MKRIAAIAAVLALALVMLTACGSNGIVGKWDGALGFVAIQLEFKSDGTYTATGLGQVFSGGGSYTVSGSRLTLNDTLALEYAIRDGKLCITIPALGELELTRR